MDIKSSDSPFQSTNMFSSSSNLIESCSPAQMQRRQPWIQPTFNPMLSSVNPLLSGTAINPLRCGASVNPMVCGTAMNRNLCESAMNPMAFGSAMNPMLCGTAMSPMHCGAAMNPMNQTQICHPNDINALVSVNAMKDMYRDNFFSLYPTYNSIFPQDWNCQSMMNRSSLVGEEMKRCHGLLDPVMMQCHEVMGAHRPIYGMGDQMRQGNVQVFGAPCRMCGAAICTCSNITGLQRPCGMMSPRLMW